MKMAAITTASASPAPHSISITKIYIHGTTKIYIRHHKDLYTAPQRSTYGTTKIFYTRHHKDLFKAPQRSIYGTTKIYRLHDTS